MAPGSRLAKLGSLRPSAEDTLARAWRWFLVERSLCRVSVFGLRQSSGAFSQGGLAHGAEFDKAPEDWRSPNLRVLEALCIDPALRLQRGVPFLARIREQSLWRGWHLKHAVRA